MSRPLSFSTVMVASLLVGLGSWSCASSSTDAEQPSTEQVTEPRSMAAEPSAETAAVATEPSVAAGDAAPTAAEPDKAPSPPPKPEASSPESSEAGSALTTEFGGTGWTMDRSAPEAVDQEERHLASAYTELEEMDSKGFLASTYITQLLRPSLEVPADELEYVEVRGQHLMGSGGFTLLWLSHAGLRHLLVVLDPKGKVRDRAVIDGRAWLTTNDLLLDETEEIIVDRTLGTGLSTYPSVWTIYRVTQWGKLRKLVTHPKSHSVGSKYRDWAYLNHFDFDHSGQLVVRTVLSACDDHELVRPCPALGDESHYVYDKGRDRFRLLRRVPSSSSSPRRPVLRESGKKKTGFAPHVSY